MRWSKAVLNGLFVWLMSLAVVALPGAVATFALGIELGSQDMDPVAMGQEIGRQVATLYAENWVLIVGLIVITAALTLWRARAVANGTWHLRWANGLVVGAVPAALSSLSVLCGGFGVLDIVTIAVYLLAGLAGGILARP
jgi:hypothetical protein